MTDINIRNMVCRHCCEAVEKAVRTAGLTPERVSLGRATVTEDDIDATRLAALDEALATEGFERIADRDSALAERAKHVILDHIRHEECHYNLSACLEDHLGVDYSAISRAFSATQGRTVEKYFMTQRVEFVKELLGYGEMTLAEIADRAGYSSAAHLARQFKSVTGMTTTEYVKSGAPRTPISEI